MLTQTSSKLHVVSTRSLIRLVFFAVGYQQSCLRLAGSRQMEI
jgi:hypothetical protein